MKNAGQPILVQLLPTAFGTAGNAALNNTRYFETTSRSTFTQKVTITKTERPVRAWLTRGSFQTESEVDYG